ncbi:unnamed protein product [Rotaria socialis]|uniref:Uncharacterized protein n=1 Tax=Rotaria socialis TaxID=392032 RepID=A0A817VUY5_9BILA|nr:unnamed protein product [Rotaria socialis]
MSLDTWDQKIGHATVLLHKNKEDDALKILTEIIDDMSKNVTGLKNEEKADLITTACLERINIHFDKKMFEEVLIDFNILEKNHYDIYLHPDSCLKKTESMEQVARANLDMEFKKMDSSL